MSNHGSSADERMLAQLLRDALANEPGSEFVLGDLSKGPLSLEGEFDLLRVASRVLSSVAKQRTLGTP
jgi:hypothetical protein